METFAQEIRVLIGHRLAGGTVNDHRVKQVIFFHQADQAAQVKWLFRLFQLRLPVFQIQTVDVSQQRFRVRNAANAQIDMFLLKPLLLALHLLQQRATDTTDAHQEQLNHLVGVEQHLMHHAHAGSGVIVIHDNGNGTL